MLKAAPSPRDYVSAGEAGVRPSRPIVVHAPSFDEHAGGTIVLHHLVHVLRTLGHEAYVHPRPYAYRPPLWPRLAPLERFQIWKRNRWHRRNVRSIFRTHPAMDTPVAPPGLARQAIAVYPEVVDGNPLEAPCVVRWLLHRPGFFNPDARFGPDELTFFYQDAFRQGVEGVDPENRLCVRWIRDDVYYDRGLPRSGACRLIRKGKHVGHDAIPDDGAVIIDGLSHEEAAEVFNRTERLYSHDVFTTYLHYAALCGCIPIIVPQPGMRRAAWEETPSERWGIAWGDSPEEIAWAVETRGRLIERIRTEREEAERSVRSFLAKLAERFG